ncbi:hypothetical protein E2562_005806 [Oryza meyeriana var. granulata]|uniref:Uncharacterized protein n=1 Tax=Oryza meyeriana var. granulata TaxID=110450 RepID=A0A6G1F4Q1_9ORYZ|nr:hypothetical protein E2562_005806 [Oryza meyeriana var. granulata]
MGRESQIAGVTSNMNFFQIFATPVVFWVMWRRNVMARSGRRISNSLGIGCGRHQRRNGINGGAGRGGAAQVEATTLSLQNPGGVARQGGGRNQAKIFRKRNPWRTVISAMMGRVR